MNLSKLDKLEARIIQYNMIELFSIAKLKSGVDLTAIEHVANLWEDEYTNLLQEWDKVTWNNVC